MTVVELDRRRLLFLAVGAAGVLGLGGTVASEQASRHSPQSRTRGRPAIPKPHPGPPVLVNHIPGPTKRIALTVDDGYSQETVAAYVRFAHDSGMHLTFGPNGAYAAEWEPHVPILRPLIAAGQVQIANHTYHHLDLRRLSPDRARAEIQSNESWINKTFGVTSRPWFRPPYGAHNSASDALAGELGFTRILLWNGDLGDAFVINEKTLLTNARNYLKPGTVMLGHANHPMVTHLYDKLVGLIRERNLQPGTLDEVFGTSRARG
jgi:peptidoglycan/xylan/chitin deacetylase (PgdA/CDA1 family)